MANAASRQRRTLVEGQSVCESCVPVWKAVKQEEGGIIEPNRVQGQCQ